jgi:hypothetical protein
MRNIWQTTEADRGCKNSMRPTQLSFPAQSEVDQRQASELAPCGLFPADPSPHRSRHAPGKHTTAKTARRMRALFKPMLGAIWRRCAGLDGLETG